MIYKNKTEKLPAIKKAIFWDENESDYKKKLNLIAGRPQHITSGEDKRENIIEMNTPASSKKLTDGDIPTVINYDEKYWFKCARGLWREITYDITKLSTVSEFSATLMYKAEGGVFLPSRFKVLVSEDCSVWETVYFEEYPTCDKAEEIIVIAAELKKKKRARFVRFSFDLDMWVFIGQLQVFGTKCVQKSAEAVKPDVKSDRKSVV